MLPETTAAPDHVLPEPRLAFMDAGRNPAPKRCAFVGCVHALLVNSVSGFVQCREQRVADVVLAHPGRDPHVARCKLGAERMVGLVEPSAFEVVAHLRGDRQAEAKLRRLAERAMQTAVVRRRLIADRAHHRDELAP